MIRTGAGEGVRSACPLVLLMLLWDRRLLSRYAGRDEEKRVTLRGPGGNVSKMDIKQRASRVAIMSASFLAACKFVAGLASGSMAVKDSGLDSMLDAFMSGMNLFAIRKAAKPADREHQYGHGRTEDLAAVGQALVIVFTGVFILYKTWEKFLRKEAIRYSSLDLGVMLLSLAFSFAISTVLRRVGKKTGSGPLLADALHYTSDLYSNSAAIIAIAITYYTGITYFDLLFSVIVGFIIIFSAVRILRNGLSSLMDTRISEQAEREICRLSTRRPIPMRDIIIEKPASRGTKNMWIFTCLFVETYTLTRHTSWRAI